MALQATKAGVRGLRMKIINSMDLDFGRLPFEKHNVVFANYHQYNHPVTNLIVNFDPYTSSVVNFDLCISLLVNFEL